MLDRPAKRDTLLELRGDVLRHQLRAELGFLDLLDRHADALPGGLLQLVTQLVDARAALADDDPGLRGVERDRQRRRGALGLDPGHASILEARQQHPPQPDILEQQWLVLLVGGKPLCFPVAVDAQPEPVRVNLVSHYLLFFSLVSRF